jgi:hypothetical protein
MRSRANREKRTRQRHGSRKQSGREKDGMNIDEAWVPGTTSGSVLPINSNGPGNLDSYLPQSADDQTVQTRASTLFEQMELHVDNYYHNVQAAVSKGQAAALSHFSSPYLPGDLISLLSHSRSRIPSIKHCFTRKMLSSTSPNGEMGPSFLPQQFALLPGTLEATDGPRREKPGKAQNKDTRNAL